MEKSQSNNTLKGYNTEEKEDEVQKEKVMKSKTVLNLSNKSYKIVKCCIFILTVGVLFMGKAFGVPKEDYAIINDPVMYDWLGGINQKINKDEITTKTLQISSSILMDLSFFMMFGYWVVRINTGRLLYSTAAFYLFRNIIQYFVVFTFPQGFFWNDPGFPSLTVPYGRSSDFFWSGHCGFLMILACEWFVQKKYHMFVITCSINAYMAIVMIGFRIHYTVDIIIGIVMAHYTFMLLTQAAPFIDNLIKYFFNYIWKLLNNPLSTPNKSSAFLQPQHNILPIQQTSAIFKENKL